VEIGPPPKEFIWMAPGSLTQNFTDSWFKGILTESQLRILKVKSRSFPVQVVSSTFRSSLGDALHPNTVTAAEPVEGVVTWSDRMEAVLVMTSAVAAEEAVDATVPHQLQVAGSAQELRLPGNHVRVLPLLVMPQELPT
jgi:hypothetical protein